MFAGCSVVRNVLFAPVDIGNVETPAMTTFGEVLLCCILFCQTFVKGFNGLEIVIGFW